MPTSRRFGLVAAVLVCAAFAPGCYAEAGPPTYVTSAEVDTYEPAYYDGYVVYYDGYGHPYYYDRGAVVWVAPSSPHYVGLVHHWRVYGPGYTRWRAREGVRYRSYRVAPGHYAYHGYRHVGPPPHRR